METLSSGAKSFGEDLTANTLGSAPESSTQKMQGIKVFLKEFGNIILAIASFLFTFLLAILNFTGKSQSLLTNLLLVSLAAIFQYLAYSVSNKAGRVDPSLVKSAVRDLIMQVSRTQEFKERTQIVFETGTNSERRVHLGALSVYLSTIEEGYLRAVMNWAEYHPNPSMVIEEINQ